MKRILFIALGIVLVFVNESGQGNHFLNAALITVYFTVIMNHIEKYIKMKWRG